MTAPQTPPHPIPKQPPQKIVQSLSMNEVAAMAKRATRGAGYDWGLAEEAAWAVRWLCERGFDGVAALSFGLAADLAGQDHWPTDISGETWVGAGVLCPLMSGAALADAGLRRDRLRLRNVAAPMLFLPFVALAASRTADLVRLSCADASADIDADNVGLSGDFPAGVADIELHRSTTSRSKPSPRVSRVTPAKADWHSLYTLAHRTYAPATEASRQRGAGAGNDTDD